MIPPSYCCFHFQLCVSLCPLVSSGYSQHFPVTIFPSSSHDAILKLVYTPPPPKPIAIFDSGVHGKVFPVSFSIFQ